MLLDRNAPGDRARAIELIEEARSQATHLRMRREIDRLDRLRSRAKAFEARLGSEIYDASAT